jgi:hypothetical protein
MKKTAICCLLVPVLGLLMSALMGCHPRPKVLILPGETFQDQKARELLTLLNLPSVTSRVIVDTLGLPWNEQDVLPYAATDYANGSGSGYTFFIQNEGTDSACWMVHYYSTDSTAIRDFPLRSYGNSIYYIYGATKRDECGIIVYVYPSRDSIEVSAGTAPRRFIAAGD